MPLSLYFQIKDDFIVLSYCPDGNIGDQERPTTQPANDAASTWWLDPTPPVGQMASPQPEGDLQNHTFHPTSSHPWSGGHLLLPLVNNTKRLQGSVKLVRFWTEKEEVQRVVSSLSSTAMEDLSFQIAASKWQ